MPKNARNDSSNPSRLNQSAGAGEDEHPATAESLEARLARQALNAEKTVRGQDQGSEPADMLGSIRQSMKSEADDQEKVLQLRHEAKHRLLGFFARKEQVRGNPQEAPHWEPLPHRVIRKKPVQPETRAQEGTTAATAAVEPPAPQSYLPQPDKHKTKSIRSIKAIRKLALEEYEEPAAQPASREPLAFRTTLLGMFRQVKHSVKSLRREAMLFGQKPRAGKPGRGESPASLESSIMSTLLDETATRESGKLSINALGQEQIRAQALQDYTDPESHSGLHGVADRLAASYRRLRPGEKRVLLSLAGLAAFLVVFGGGFLLLRDLSASIARIQAAKAVPTPSTPYPVRMRFPGELEFSLRQGFIQDGMWFPQGAEWLAGTEICRWIALPWSRTTERAVRALELGDEITLAMSNADELIFAVAAVEMVDVSSEQVDEYGSQTPCLFVFLVKKDSNSRWMVTAYP